MATNHCAKSTTQTTEISVDTNDIQLSSLIVYIVVVKDLLDVNVSLYVSK